MLKSLDHFKIDEIEVLVDICQSNFSKPHTPSELWLCQLASHLTLATGASYVYSFPAVRLSKLNLLKIYYVIIFIGFFHFCVFKRF